ncbi:hypothetical protein Tco_0932637 [Tanacetum coccineum]
MTGPPNSDMTLMMLIRRFDLENVQCPSEEQDSDEYYYKSSVTIQHCQHQTTVPGFYMCTVGIFPMELRRVSNFKIPGLLQPWQTLCKIFSKCLTTRVTGWDQPPLQIMKMLYCFVNNIHVDYAELIRISTIQVKKQEQGWDDNTTMDEYRIDELTEKYKMKFRVSITVNGNQHVNPPAPVPATEKSYEMIFTRYDSKAKGKKCKESKDFNQCPPPTRTPESFLDSRISEYRETPELMVHNTKGFQDVRRILGDGLIVLDANELTNMILLSIPNEFKILRILCKTAKKMEGNSNLI